MHKVFGIFRFGYSSFDKHRFDCSLLPTMYIMISACNTLTEKLKFCECEAEFKH